MIGFTSMASTPLMEHKQKTTIIKAIVSPVVENVVTFDVISFDNIQMQLRNLKVIDKDVGWINRKVVNFVTFYKEIQNQEIEFIGPITQNCRSNC
jgi:ABC-type enterochelin transport system substrate-binding protein